MFNYILTCGMASCLALSAHSQMSSPILYKDEVFAVVSVQRDLSYHPEPVSGRKWRANLYDWYEPKQDSSNLRPLIIWMHGGGFRFGSKKEKAIRLWSASFARRGYGCAAINYRMGKRFQRFDFTGLVQGCYEAMQDARQAIAYFKQHAVSLRIDTNRIVLAGNSAGGIMAVQLTYSSDGELMQLIGHPDSGQMGRSPEPGHIAAVVNFWGGIFQTSWLENARVPIVSVHGKKDRIVPYDHKGFPLYGSLAIHRAADSLQIPNKVKIYDNYAHQLQTHFFPLLAGRATKKRWLEAGQFAADFLYEQLFAGAR